MPVPQGPLETVIRRLIRSVRGSSAFDGSSTLFHPPSDLGSQRDNVVIFSPDHLEDYAQSLARTHGAVVIGRGVSLRSRLDAQATLLAAAYKGLDEVSGRPGAVTPAAEWLVENYHVVDEHIRTIRHDLPREYYRELPKLAYGEHAGFPRIYLLAKCFLEHSDNRLDVPALDRFCRAYQRVQILTIGELWALALTLRIILLENLSRLAAGMMHRMELRRRADDLADRAEIDASDAEGPRLPDLERRIEPPFAARLYQRLRDHDPAKTPLLAWLDERLQAAGASAPDLVAGELRRQGAANVSVQNIIVSLRHIAQTDWTKFFESVSLVDELLRQNSAFAEFDFPTRDRYRHSIEDLARRSSRSELEVAGQALDLARQTDAGAASDAEVASDADARSNAEALAAGPMLESEPGYFLIDAGRPVLERSIDYRMGLRERAVRALRSAGLPGYAGAAAAVAAVPILLSMARSAPISAAVWAVALLSFVALSDSAVALVNLLIAKLCPPDILPAYELRAGVSAELRTLIAVPMLLTSREDIEANLRTLEVHHLASQDGDLRFALLSDWADSAAETDPADAILLEVAARGVGELNRRYGSVEGGARFFLLHRRRKWNAQESKWMGWERKRGKLQELNRLLRGAADTTFVALGEPPVLEVPDGVRYVICLDADTRLPRNAARRLIGKMAHPLNRPRFASSGGRVIRGYGILQPRVMPALPIGARGTLFQYLLSGPQGMDPYAMAVSDTYQDLFGEGSFTGKGIYDVDAFDRALEGRTPENRLLSHDLFEGIYARSGLASDIEIVEEYPPQYHVAAARQHRWIRGDWQLLPWILGARSDMTALGRFKMADNLRRSLVSPAIFAGFALAWIAGLPTSWSVLLAASLVLPYALPLADRIIPRREDFTSGTYLKWTLKDVKVTLGAVALHAAMLPYQALLSGDAIVRTLVRVAVTHRHLLEWTTSAQAQKRRGHTRRSGLYRAFSTSLLACLAIGAWIWIERGEIPFLACMLLVIWIFQAEVARIVSISGKEIVFEPLSRTGQETLTAIARQTWSYFDTFVTAEHNFLPPDNFQEDPAPVVARRTSPTNIGLYLLGIVCAKELRWIDAANAIERLEATFATLDKLERYRGHFLNWYDTKDLRTLDPQYVSTVDSGNLAGHLIALASALESWETEAMGRVHDPEDRDAPPAAALAVRARQLGVRARQFALQMDYRFLVNSERELLSIGYQVTERTLDINCYDLLATEARLGILFAIAKGDVDAKMWYRLGRSLVPADGRSALISWSGSMFEYLMPELVLEEPPGSILGETAQAIVARQIAYGRENRIPWGISESALNARDREFTYQYSSFGVPGLGLKRGLAADAVVAPYATGLASMLAPAEAVKNFAQLREQGAHGTYGFYEALDYTPARLPEGSHVVPIRAFMAHHQGMILAAITNVLKDYVLRRRFHADPLVGSVELLLHERSPQASGISPLAHQAVRNATAARELATPAPRRFHSPHQSRPQTHLLSNGRYSVMLTSVGSGYSRCGPIAVSRWREDPVCDPWGSYVFVRDVGSEEIWSAGYQPTGAEPDDYTVSFYEDRAEYERRDGEVSTAMEVAVSTEDDVEVRRVAITNRGGHTRDIELTSYMEIVLGSEAADRSHPAFSKLFVQTEYLGREGALLATRRVREPGEPTPFLFHLTHVDGQSVGSVQYETDRARFLGRGRCLREAGAIADAAPLSNTCGTVLDPILAMRRRIRIEPGGTVRVTFWTGVAWSRDKALSLIDKYRDPGSYERVRGLAWTLAQVQLRYLGITFNEAHDFQRLASQIIYMDASLRAPRDVLGRNRRGQPDLWPLGISGDLPIVLVQVYEQEEMGTVQALLRAYEYFRLKQLSLDLVFVNHRGPSYLMELQNQLDSAIRGAEARLESNTRLGRVFALRRDTMDGRAIEALETAARVILSASRGSWNDPLGRVRDDIAERPSRAADKSRRRARDVGPRPAPPTLEYFNGLGGFAAHGGEYVTRLSPGELTPAPWSNVIANERFGFLASTDGAGHTWLENSRENQITAWSNDPVTNHPSEAIYLRDEDEDVFWSATPLPRPAPNAHYSVRHGFGHTAYLHATPGLEVELTQFVPLGAAVKVSHLKITNTSAKRRRLSVTYYAEWCLGSDRVKSAPFIVTQFASSSGALCARNPWNKDFGGRLAYMAIPGHAVSHTGDRNEFIGRHGTLAAPRALLEHGDLSNRAGGGFDPCGSLRTHIVIEPQEAVEVDLHLGQETDLEAIDASIAKQRAQPAAEHLAAIAQFWRTLTGAVTVKTPDRALDVLMNGWLLYQTLSSRIWGRTGFYQASGAYGFRDQLQDVMALCIARPALAREHILRAAARQYVEGDVQHWWLPGSGLGVRTRISDNRIWLPYVVAHYLEVSGDRDILDEQIRYLQGSPIPDQSSESFEAPTPSEVTGSLFDHCARALDCSLAIGPHGLPLFGTGDWNDGMNRVGAKGRGESVWLGWFLHATLLRFSDVADPHGAAEKGSNWRKHAFALQQAIEREAWDGDWYRRGYFDDGTPLGSISSDECRIDSIAQSWASISQGGSPAHAQRAMAQVNLQLIDRSEGLIRLFTPPFSHTSQDPGYIKAYPAGLRENGGQYTHAATWTVLAFALLGDGDRAGELLSLLNPIHHANTAAAVQRYQVEPYVVAADVYTAAGHMGRGGWTWYTGSAAWYYRVALESVIGLRLHGQTLEMAPCIPKSWRELSVVLHRGRAVYTITVLNPDGATREIREATRDGVPLGTQPCTAACVDDGEPHEIRVVMGR
jgi:cyclic beta-1,2-glucan synthetase